MQSLPETTPTALSQTERTMREFSELLPHMLWLADSEGAVYFVNKVGLNYFGIALLDIIGWNWDQVVHSDDLPGVFVAWSHARAVGERYVVHYRLRRFDGTWRWFLCSAEPHKDQHGKVLRWVGNSVDIEDDKAAEQKAQLAEHEMRLALDTAPLMILRCNRDGIYTVIAGEVLRSLGLRRESMLGRNAFDLIPTYPLIQNLICRGLNGETMQSEVGFQDRWLDMRVQPIRNAQGALDGATIAILDITERRENERLVQSEKAAHEATALKNQFLANMSHEVRTPLSGVLGMTDLLLESQLTDEQRRYAEIIQTSGRGLLAVLNDILDFSKLDAGKVQLEAVPFKLGAFVENQAELMSPKALEKNLTLMTFVDPALPDWLIGDSVRIGQILLNLLSNAIKFTERGNVVVSVEAVAPNALKNLSDTTLLGVRFSVRDSGIGMDADTLNRLYQPFMQADVSTARRFGGTGLGLSICHRLAELMGGSITVDSEVGSGTRFSCIVPLVVDHETLGEAMPSLSALRCLVVDADRTATQILAAYLTHAQAQVDCVHTGAQALEALHTHAWNGAPYTTVLCDKRMADMDATALLHKLQALGFARNPDVIVVDPHNSRSAAQAAHIEGFAAYLTKPLRRVRLLKCLASLTVDNPTHAEARATMAGFAVPATAPKPCKVAPASINARPAAGDVQVAGRILVAEDNQVNQLIICAQLKKLGYRVTTVVNGQEAIEALAKNNFDLVFMDCQMPVLDGYQATRAIRAMGDGHQGRVPIIALTANAMREDKERCLQAGMDDYVSKPFTPKILTEVVATWLSGKQRPHVVPEA